MEYLAALLDLGISSILIGTVHDEILNDYPSYIAQA